MKRAYWVLIAGVALMLGYEIYATISGGPDTISEIVWAISNRPVVPFAFGLLMGHFFLCSSR